MRVCQADASDAANRGPSATGESASSVTPNSAAMLTRQALRHALQAQRDEFYAELSRWNVFDGTSASLVGNYDSAQPGVTTRAIMVTVAGDTAIIQLLYRSSTQFTPFRTEIVAAVRERVTAMCPDDAISISISVDGAVRAQLSQSVAIAAATILVINSCSFCGGGGSCDVSAADPAIGEAGQQRLTKDHKVSAVTELVPASISRTGVVQRPTLTVFAVGCHRFRLPGESDVCASCKPQLASTSQKRSRENTKPAPVHVDTSVGMLYNVAHSVLNGAPVTVLTPVSV